MNNDCSTRFYAKLSGPITKSSSNSDGFFTTNESLISSPFSRAIVTVTTTRTLLGDPIMVYSIPQIIAVTYPASLANGGKFMRNYPVNRTDFRVVRGTQNEINFYVRDVDRKPVPLQNTETLTIKIVDPVTNELLLSRNLTTIDSAKGIYLLTFLPSEMDLWPTSPLNWSMTYNRANNTSVLLWTDNAYTSHSTLTLFANPAPQSTNTNVLLSSDIMLLSDNNYYTSSLVGAAKFGYANGMQTFNIFMTGFTGNIRIDASLIDEPLNDSSSPDWFQIDLQTYTNYTGNVVLNEQGSYLWMRTVILPAFGNTGSVTQIQYKGY